MQVATHIHDAVLSQAFRSYVERKLRFSLSRFGARAGHVKVHITMDGGGEVRCRISAEVLPFGQVAVDERDFDAFAALDRAAGRMGRLFARELERARIARIGRESVRLTA